MRIQSIRHATMILQYNNKKLLVDPVLSPKNTMPAIKGVPNKNDNPLTDLPIGLEALCGCDAVLVTHTHSDHFDGEAVRLLPKNMPVFCQPEDEAKLKAFGFSRVMPVKDRLEWEGVRLDRTKGRHGHGIIAARMAPVSGYVISACEEPSLYLMGDTVWCDHTEKALEKYAPGVVISYCGEARFSRGKAITMDSQDILSVCTKVPAAKVVAVHMEAWNHCRLTRQELGDFIRLHGIERQVCIPENGEIIDFDH